MDLVCDDRVEGHMLEILHDQPQGIVVHQEDVSTVEPDGIDEWLSVLPVDNHHVNVRHLLFELVEPGAEGVERRHDQSLVVLLRLSLVRLRVPSLVDRNGLERLTST